MTSLYEEEISSIDGPYMLVLQSKKKRGSENREKQEGVKVGKEVGLVGPI